MARTVLFASLLWGLVHVSVLSALPAFARKPKVWIISDRADNKLERAPGKHVTDPHGISASAGYLLMSSE